MARGAPDPEGFRETLAAYPTGVTVVTAIGPDGPAGATVSAVTSLSLDPPMMLACLDRGSRTLESVRASGRFGVNALAAGQERLALRFAAKDPALAKWEGVEWSEREGSPRLADSLMWVACELRDLTSGGDHLIATGIVLEAESRKGMPLIFHGGVYRDLLDES